jgi:hypothetical protein
MIALEAVTTPGETSALCQSVGLARATLYRRRQPARPSTPTVRAASPRALVPAERQAVLDVLHSERFIDQSPAEVQATLLDEQTFLCSTRTMYRILDAAQDGPQPDLELGHHQAEGRHPLPVLLAVCDPGFVQSVRRGLDGRCARERPPGPALDRGDLPQTGDRPTPAHDPRRPRRADAQQARLVVVLGPRDRGEPLPAARQQ